LHRLMSFRLIKNLTQMTSCISLNLCHALPHKRRGVLHHLWSKQCQVSNTGLPIGWPHSRLSWFCSVRWKNWELCIGWANKRRGKARKCWTKSPN
jgi:hypothetical protein